MHDDWTRVEVENRFTVGGSVDDMQPNGSRNITATRMLSEDGRAIEMAPGSGHVVRIELGAALDRALLACYL